MDYQKIEYFKERLQQELDEVLNAIEHAKYLQSISRYPKIYDEPLSTLELKLDAIDDIMYHIAMEAVNSL
jgi:hypothetical protein